ncbi:MAG: homoserine O-acetyltransferase [Fimbriimonadaceae bacterium]|nr:homoserine O-acetyltransferase [Fimbriimonadaceae bacterium]
MDAALFQENERTAPVSAGRLVRSIGPMVIRDTLLPNVEIAYETYGQPSLFHDNAVLICHALSGDAHAIGWWDRMIGPGKPIDTERYFVICTNVLGGCQGSTGPASIAGDGRPYGSRFPMITVEDMVDAQALLLSHLGIERLHAVCGGSMGGMQALAWAVRYPDRVRKVFTTASCAAHSAMQIGFNEVGRQAILRDPKWNGGDYDPSDPPAAGLAVARMLGHLSFLSDAAFTQKFDRRLQDRSAFRYDYSAEFQVESYLRYQGEKFTRRFDANSLLVLTRAIDYFELTSLDAAEAEFLFVSYTSDWLYPTAQSAQLQQLALQAGHRSRHIEIDLPYGHDAFLLDGKIQGEHVAAFLAE